jgi:hypothetical protein
MNKHFGILLLGFIILLIIVTPLVVSHTAYGSKKNSDKNSGGSSDGKGSSGDSGNSNDNPPADNNQQSDNNQPSDQQGQQQEQQNQQPQPCPDGSQPDDKGKCPPQPLMKKSEKENCDNGVDDNGDGLVDKQDPQCAKAGTTDNTGNTQTSDTNQPTTTFYDNKQLESMPQPPPCPDNQPRDINGNCPPPQSSLTGQPNLDPDLCLKVFGQQQVKAGIPTPPQCKSPPPPPPQNNGQPSTNPQNLQQQKLNQPSGTDTEPAINTNKPLTTFGLPQPLGAPTTSGSGGNTEPSGKSGTEQPSTSTDKQQKSGSIYTKPDGTVIFRDPNGIETIETKVYKQPDGTVIYNDIHDGIIRTQYPNGDSRITYQKEGPGHIGVEYVHQDPGVSQFMQFKDGSTRKWIFGEPKKAQIIDTLRDGTSITQQYAKTVTKKPDGTTITDSGGQTVTKKPDGTTITDSGGHWNIKFPPRPDGSTKTYYEDGTTVIEKDGKIIKRFKE